MITIQALYAFLISVTVAYLLTPFMKIIAIKTNLLDTPNDRKIHTQPMPLLGGLVIYLAFFIALLFTAHFDEKIIGVLIGGMLLVGVGLIDDKFKAMPPQLKLLGQILAALTVVKLDIRISFIQNNFLNIFFSCFWIVGITNAFNLLDNMNGLSAGIAAIAALFFAFISFLNGQLLITILSLSVVGACLGFLKYNFPKAQIFMGDAGSLFIGFVLSTIALLGDWKSKTFFNSIMIPILILGYPIFDTFLVTLIRSLEGRHIFIGGKDHSSHRLVALGLTTKNAVLVMYTIAAVLGVMAFIVSRINLIPALALYALLLIFFGVFTVFLTSRGENKIAIKRK